MLEARIAERWQRRHCVLTGHGSTAIYFALKVIESRRGAGEVLVPAIACPSIAEIVLHAGFAPRFVDIRLDDFTMDVTSLEASISSATRAILPVHLYGHACDMTQIVALARKHELPLIEDAAQSPGGVHDGRLLGSFGDFALFSFGGTKIIAAGGGGALLFDDDDALPVVQRELEAMPPFAEDARSALLVKSYGNLFHATVDFLRVNPNADMRFAYAGYRELYFHRFPEDRAETIAAGIATLDDRNAERLARAERYHAQVSQLPVHASDAWRRSGSIWRYTFLLRTPEETIRVSRDLRRQGVDASNHYWSLADVFAGDKSLPHAREFQSRVVNFWVDERASDDYIDHACAALANALR